MSLQQVAPDAQLALPLVLYPCVVIYIAALVARWWLCVIIIMGGFLNVSQGEVKTAELCEPAARAGWWGARAPTVNVRARVHIHTYTAPGGLDHAPETMWGPTHAEKAGVGASRRTHQLYIDLHAAAGRRTHAHVVLPRGCRRCWHAFAASLGTQHTLHRPPIQAGRQAGSNAPQRCVHRGHVRRRQVRAVERQLGPQAGAAWACAVPHEQLPCRRRGGGEGAGGGYAHALAVRAN